MYVFSSNSAKPSPPCAPENPAPKKSKGKAGCSIPTSLNPLDQTCIHPESYHVAQRYGPHKHTPLHTHTCSAANPTGRACSDKDGADFNTVSYGAGYSGGGLWFDLRRHGIQERRRWLSACAWRRVSLCEKWLLELLMLLSKAHWTSAAESRVRAHVCWGCLSPFSCSCSHSTVFSLHTFWH